MKILYSKENRILTYEPYPDRNQYNKSISAIRFYDCNPTLIALFLVKCNEEMKSSTDWALSPIIMDYWDRYGHDWGTTHVRWLKWNEAMTELTVMTYDDQWEEHRYLEIVAGRLGCKSYYKVMADNKELFGHEEKDSRIYLFRNSMTQLSATIHESFNLKDLKQVEKVIYKYLSY